MFHFVDNPHTLLSQPVSATETKTFLASISQKFGLLSQNFNVIRFFFHMFELVSRNLHIATCSEKTWSSGCLAVNVNMLVTNQLRQVNWSQRRKRSQLELKFSGCFTSVFFCLSKWRNLFCAVFIFCFPQLVKGFGLRCSELVTSTMNSVCRSLKCALPWNIETEVCMQSGCE